MALLDKKERVYDVVLTNKGRELLSKNQLSFSYYTFSDDSIDYSGSISDVLSTTGTLDDYIQKIPFFESNQMKRTRGNRDLKSFLFTAPIGSRTVTEFRTSLTGSLTLKRKYRTVSLSNIIKSLPAFDNKVYVNYVEQILEASKTEIRRADRYLYAQKVTLEYVQAIEQKIEESLVPKSEKEAAMAKLEKLKNLLIFEHANLPYKEERVVKLVGELRALEAQF